ncbi:ribbon-helix-helix protein, CopG family [Corynebacterium sanguinis]|uniref:ribbon-helix-helix protein, CopG family n=1 Tax=Corynebacterium sanguinis TaxID=2594913 RepID=UPI0021A4EB74|nr:ribbon-helix-helix protein, CopG family [Corynebacterium sanguinis]MCT1413057.1 ribbon-helix-helix protein, CopG family [Corynebacterium sanguinis]
MTSKKQQSHSSGKVVSVRLEESVIERLDALVERTGRTRGFYLRMAIGAMLPTLEDAHWNQTAARFEDDVVDRQFREIMARLLGKSRPEQGGLET